MKIFRMGELFCGPGGLALGASRVQIEGENEIYSVEHAWVTDYDEDACATIRHNLFGTEIEKVLCTNVSKLNITKLAPIDALAFGFPCNDYSAVGEKKGIKGEFGPLYSYGVKVVKQFNPQWFIAENVSGLQSANEGKTFHKILQDLEQAGKGYTLTTHLYKFEDYGVPQARHRIIIVGIRSDLGLQFKVPAPTHIGRPKSAQEAIDHPPIPQNAPNNEHTNQSKTVIERLKHTKPGENAWTAKLPPKLQLNVKGFKVSQIYRRLDPKKPAYTITGSGGGGTHTYHWSEPRALTNRERARLQTFPDDYIFQGSKESVRRQIGMAVPPLGAQVIVEAILRTFAGIPYPSISPKWSRANGNGNGHQLELLDVKENYKTPNTKTKRK